MIYYRLPDTDTGFVIEPSQAPEQLSTIETLEGRHGFVVAPFRVSAETPIYLFSDEEQRTYKIPQKTMRETPGGQVKMAGMQEARIAYHAVFTLFHRQLIAGRFPKIVLARRQRETVTGSYTLQELFENACRMYPHCFVALAEIPRQGVWFTATPEVLLQNTGSYWATMALAGTMRKDDKHRWSRKNQQEQQLVAQYIEEILRSVADQVKQSEPYTFMAGGLKHLRSDFRFILKPQIEIAQFLATLHPTPAVCGIPKQDTYNFITDNEPSPRKYYGGFMGPFQMNKATHLYVSLRCVNINGRLFDFYAGGGLLPDSEEEMEWEETVAKMEQIKNVLFNHQ